MNRVYLLFLTVLVSCTENNSNKGGTGVSSTSFTTNDTVAAARDKVSQKPVASYIVPVNDPRLGRTFGVEVYETPQTFEYLLRMHYEAMQVTDTLRIPNFGILPTVEIKPGKDKLSCIIGFQDKKKEFKEYKMVSVKGNKMKLVVLKKYFTGRYRNVY